MIRNWGGMYTELKLEFNVWYKAEIWTSDEKEEDNKMIYKKTIDDAITYVT